MISLVYAWASLALLLATLRDSPDSQVESYVFLCSVPAIAFSGSSFVLQRLRSLQQQSEDSLGQFSSACMVDLRMRLILTRPLSAAEAVLAFKQRDEQGVGAGNFNAANLNLKVVRVT